MSGVLLNEMISAGRSALESPTTSNITSGEQQVDISTYGTALLASFIGFIRPATVSQASDSNVTRLCKSAQGQELLRTLGEFVNLVINTTVHGASSEQEDISGTSIEGQVVNEQPYEMLSTDSISNMDELLLLCNMVDVYPAEPNPIPREIIEAVHKHIFNVMPIRMISFDSQGGNCALVERGELASIILARIRAAYPRQRQLIRISRSPNGIVKSFCKYAILSHTWLRGLPGDVVFQTWGKRTLPQNARGNAKIDNFCAVAARKHDMLLGWMDTVCINKESSAELDESIRSMYEWYRKANVCIAYLADTDDFAQIPQDTWWTRGWTLQELLANERIYFYNQDWAQLLPGDFTAHPLGDPQFKAGQVDSQRVYLTMPEEVQYQVFKATSITQIELVNFYFYPRCIPICRIMELAAQRNVTREEDQIYSLMGLLGTGISISYGEGSKNTLKRMLQQIMISREIFLDLFNHNNPEHILPEAITDYNGHVRTIQNPVVPRDPLILSHLGVHATLLAIPVFKEDVYKNDLPLNTPMGHTSWKGHSLMSNPQSYVALDNSKHASEWISSLDICLSPRNTTWNILDDPPFIFLAILSSRVDQEHDNFQISVGDSLGIPVLPDLLNPSEDSITKQFRDIRPYNPSSNATGWRRLGPVRINLPYSGPNVSKDGILTLTTEEAKKAGL